MTCMWYYWIMNTTDIMISVVIPLFNGARVITQALDSVFAQSVAPIEVIVVDDGSTDDGPAITERYATRQPLTLYRKPNGGQSSARNFGVERACGNLIAFLDQDDIWYPQHLRELSRPFLRDDGETLGWTYSDLDEIGEDGGLRARYVLSEGSAEHPKTRLEKCLGEDMFILPSASMVARSAFNAVGGFDERLRGYEDDDLFTRLFHAGYRNVYIDQPLGQWRVYSGSSSHSSSMAVSRMVYARKLLSRFPDQPNAKRFYASELIAPRFLRQVVSEARLAFRRGDIASAELHLENISLLERHISPEPKPYPFRHELFITAIIPLYNGANFIGEAIKSVLEQTLLPDEIIVVDDGSTDAGPVIVREMGQRHPIRLINKPNGGQSTARNLGVEHAHGDLIAFLDQDDVWYPNHLETLVKPFLEPSTVEIGWTYSDLDEINERGELVTRGVLARTGAEHPKRDLAGCLRHDMFVLPSASLISRRAFRQVGGFDERLSGYEDDDLFLRLFQAGFQNVFLPDPGAKWRMYGMSSSYSPQMAISRVIYARKLIQRFPDSVDMDRYPVRDLIAPRFFRLMAMETRKAIMQGTKEQRRTALGNLRFITGHMPAKHRVPLRFIGLPALRIPLLNRLIIRHRGSLIFVFRRIFR